MKVVLDTSAIIYLNDFRLFKDIITVNDVVEELEDKTSALKLSGLHIKILEPSEKSLKEVKITSKKTGDLDKLSKTDLKILALAKELNLVIVSDDYNIQNVAEKLGIKYLSLFNKKITKLIFWSNYCENCKKYSDDVRFCFKCGNRLVRKPKAIEDIKRKKTNL